MAEMKIVIGEKTGKCKQIVLNDEQSKSLFGKKIRETFKGELIDMTGYEFEITGGSDYTGTPMRRDLPGIARKKILAVGGTGIKPGRKGQRQRKTMAGNTVYDKTAQLNVKVIKAGKTPLFEEVKAEEAPAEEAKAE